MFHEPALTYGGQPTKLQEKDAAFVRGGLLRFVRRFDIVMGEIPFSAPAETFHAFMAWLAKQNGLMCVPYNPNRTDLLAVTFRHSPMDALVSS